MAHEDPKGHMETDEQGRLFLVVDEEKKEVPKAIPIKKAFKKIGKKK